jgi:hypothetical protein
MATRKRKPAIERPQGVIDDVLSATLRFAGRKIAKSPKKGAQKTAQKAFDKAYRHEVATITGMRAGKLKGSSSSKNALERLEKLNTKESVALAKSAAKGYSKYPSKKIDKLKSQQKAIKNWAITDIDDYIKAEKMPRPTSARGKQIIGTKKSKKK